jgi:hypothetical protein
MCYDAIGNGVSRSYAHMPDVTRAQDLEPRAYVDTPVGMNFLIASYAYSEGGVATDPSVPIESAELELNTFVLAYALL